MSTYIYRARDRYGKLVVGQIDAASLIAAEKNIENLKLIPLSVEEKSSISMSELIPSFQSVSKKDIIIFSRQLATLYQSGVPISKSLTSLIEFTRNKKLKIILQEVKDDIESGQTLAKSLGNHPKIFSEIYVNMVEVGESTGLLYDVLVRIALLMEKEMTIKSKVKSATFYPKLVISAIIIATAILIGFVIPKFAMLYSSFNVPLPLETRILVVISNFFVNYWYIMLAIFAALIISVKLYLNSAKGRLWWDEYKLKIPIFGSIFYKSMMGQFTRIFGLLFQSGIPVNRAFELIRNAVENKYFTKKIDELQEEIAKGNSITQSFIDSKIFSPIIIQMISIGEETGHIDEMLNKVADYFDEDLDHQLSILQASIEPILLTIIFGMVLFLALAIYLPIIDVINFVKK
ncbi:MAG: type II secretion system F family protein [Candidatus Acididesulfobacter diazotrophicus]|jgi:MSHA biogenesis protein MshG|uniref:Type II secretion system F family protein n=1 Tax=Candidatus Acididesulfobacter diazotrophicus TaxID=2597226 RepID=A0A519BM41_9DELT|nr:MAG: type II secretion system F family protein [Candidatus Acididesulfobacter diazotrophicus]